PLASVCCGATGLPFTSVTGLPNRSVRATVTPGMGRSTFRSKMQSLSVGDDPARLKSSNTHPPSCCAVGGGGGGGTGNSPKQLFCELAFGGSGMLVMKSVPRPLFGPTCPPVVPGESHPSRYPAGWNSTTRYDPTFRLVNR